MAVTIPYLVLLVRPQIVFGYEARADNVVLHSRAPLSAKAVEIASAAEQRVKRSPLYVPTDTYDVYLCDTPRSSPSSRCGTATPAGSPTSTSAATCGCDHRTSNGIGS